jgi:hypothetical protein
MTDNRTPRGMLLHDAKRLLLTARKTRPAGNDAMKQAAEITMVAQRSQWQTKRAF